MTAQLTVQDLPNENAPLREVQEYVRKMAIERGHSKQIPVEMMYLTEEVGELSKALREHIGGDFDAQTSRKDLYEEFADCLYNLLNLANLAKVDIFDAMIGKEKINQTRNWKKLKEEN
jgi:NTP pyrophosphatase (non-canonical NTP hydrolase)